MNKKMITINKDAYIDQIVHFISKINKLEEIVERLNKDVEQLKKKTGWVHGYDDHGWTEEDIKREEHYHNITTRAEMDSYFKRGDK